MKKLFTLAVGLIALTQSFAQVQRSERDPLISNSYLANGVPSQVSYTIPANFEVGQNRYLAILYMGEFTNDISYPTAISYNGKAMKLSSTSTNVETQKGVVQVWVMNEADLAGTTSGTPHPVDITWNSKRAGSYFMAAVAFRYASQITDFPSYVRTRQGNSSDTMRTPTYTAKAGDLLYHFSFFTRIQNMTISTGNTDSANTLPVATNSFLGAPVLNDLRPSADAANQGKFLVSTWANIPPAGFATYTYNPTFQNRSGSNPTKWIVGAAAVPYQEYLKPVSGKVWIDKNGNGLQDDGSLPGSFNPSEYRVVVVSKSGVTQDPFNGKVRYQFTINADGTWSGNVNAERFRTNNDIANPTFADPAYEFALVKVSGDFGSTINEGAAPPPSYGGNSAMGVAPNSSTALYAPQSPANTNDRAKFFLPINLNGVSASTLDPSDASYTGANDQKVNFAIQSPPKNIDASIGAGTLKGKQFIPLGGSPVSAIDAEDGSLETGNKLIITKINETFPGINGKNFTIKLAYVPSNLTRQPTESDVILQSQLPLTIDSYNPDNLYAYYIEGDGSLVGVELFEYTFVDAAGATGGLPPTPGNQIGNGGQILGSGQNGEGVFSFTGVLPVNSLELAGSYNSGKASLRWKLNGSDDVSRYELERGNNASGFRTVATMSSNGREYNHVDDLSSFTGSDAFYRVKLVRTNGAVSYSNVISLKLATITGLQLMPTIVQSNLQVRFNNTRSQDVTIRVMNISGQAVMTQTSKLSAGNASISLNGFERLTNGTYSVQVFAGSTVTQGKIVVQH